MHVSCKHADHPEHPNRIKELSSRLEREGLLGKCTRLTPKLVSVHSTAARGYLLAASKPNCLRLASLFTLQQVTWSVLGCLDAMLSYRTTLANSHNAAYQHAPASVYLFAAGNR